MSTKAIWFGHMLIWSSVTLLVGLNFFYTMYSMKRANGKDIVQKRKKKKRKCLT
jgi:hypothetical protein